MCTGLGSRQNYRIRGVFFACGYRVLLATALWLSCSASGLAQPAASFWGNTGLWKVLTTDTLARGQFSVSAFFDKLQRNPGNLTVETTVVSAAQGLTRRLEFGFALEANRHVSVASPEQLSFGQQALGFFGNRTPGSPPSPEELVTVSSQMPQLRFRRRLKGRSRAPPDTTIFCRLLDLSRKARESAWRRSLSSLICFRKLPARL